MRAEGSIQNADKEVLERDVLSNKHKVLSIEYTVSRSHIADADDRVRWDVFRCGVVRSETLGVKRSGRKTAAQNGIKCLRGVFWQLPRTDLLEHRHLLHVASIDLQRVLPFQ
jgi:hypothetical protein